MLVENKNVRQRYDEGFRRWFTSTNYDLILWYQEQGGELLGFQLCYDKRQEEKAVTVELRSRSYHFIRTEERENPGFAGLATGILRGDPGDIHKDLINDVVAELSTSKEIEVELKALIVEGLKSFAAPKP